MISKHTKVFGLCALIVLLLTLPTAIAQIARPDPGHHAGQIGGGNFSKDFGDFIFPQNLTVTENTSVLRMCLDSDCRTTWPTNNINDCTDVNACTITAEDTSAADDQMLDGDGDAWPVDSSGLCGAGNVCTGGHTHNYDYYHRWILNTEGVYREWITTNEDFNIPSENGMDPGWDGSRDISFNWDCDDIATVALDCSDDDIFVVTDYEEEVHCTDHDGTGLSCNTDELYIESGYQGAEIRCADNQYLNGDNTCDSGYLDADGSDDTDDPVSTQGELTNCELDPQVDTLDKEKWCVGSGTTAIKCETDAPITACSQCDSSYIKETGESTGVASSDFNFDSNTLVLDVSANTVGIGTTSPLSKLSINHAGSSGSVMRAYKNTTEYVDFATSNTGILAFGSDTGIVGSGDNQGFYGSGGIYGLYASVSGADHISGIYATGGSTATILASANSITAVRSYGSTEISYGGLCIDDSTGCTSSTAGDGDVVIRDGGLCIGESSCLAPSDGEINLSGSLYVQNALTYAYMGIGSDADTEIYYSATNDRYQLYDSDNGYADITVSGCTGCADIAEHASVPEDENLESGDVLIISGDEISDLTKSSSPFSNDIAGVFSSTPAIYMGDLSGNPRTGGMKLGGDNHNFTDMKGTDHNGTVPLALSGQVPVKVCLENGIIEKGDPLTTSSYSGHGMKWSILNPGQAKDLDDLKRILSTNEERRGSIFGKALDPFDGSDSTHENHLGQPCGMIRVFLALH